MKLLKNYTTKPYSFLVIDATYNLHHIIFYISEKNIPERIKKLIITIDDKIRDKKLQYNISREAAVLSSGKIDK